MGLEEEGEKTSEAVNKENIWEGEEKQEFKKSSFEFVCSL